jgi:hypothetical protein
MHVDCGWIVDVGRALQQDADLTLLAHRLLRSRDRLRTAQSDRQHQAGKQHGVAHRHDDQRVSRQWRQGAAARSVFCKHFSHEQSPLFAM